MKLILKQKFLSWFNTYNIYDENDNVVYSIKGELSLGHKLRFFDKNNNEVGLLQEKVFTFLPKFYMYDNSGNEIGVISKKFNILKPKYELSCNGWKTTGDFWQWNYSIIDNEEEKIATIKRLLSFADNYEIDIPNETNSLLVLMIVTAIDIDKESSAEAATSSIN